MTLRHLRIFLAVCREGTTTAAAEKLYIAQPTISVAIRELEAHYRVTLFDRIGRRLYLTDAGEQMRSYAQHIVSLLDEMENRSQDWEETGTLRLGSSITIGTVQLPGLAAQLQKQYPKLRIEVMVCNSDTVEGALLHNEIDLGLIEGGTHSARLRDVPLGGDELAFLCHPRHPFAGRTVEVRQLRDQPFLFRERGSAGRNLVESTLRVHGVEVRPLWQSISTQTLVSSAAAGLGLAVLPLPLIQPALDAGTIRRFWVEGVSFTRRFRLLYHQNKYLTRPMESMIRLCRAAWPIPPAHPPETRQIQRSPSGTGHS